MRVSFIIVARNAGDKVGDSLACLLKQDYPHKDIEVILVDGASTDNTKKIFDSYCRDYSDEFYRVIVLNNEKKTLPCGWNIALKESRGDIILRIDAHATIPENFISNNVRLIESGETIVGGQRPSIIEKNSGWQKMLLTAEQSLFGSGMASYRKDTDDKYVSTLAHAAYSRKVFEKVGGYDERLARTEDNEMHYRMKSAGNKFLLSHSIKSYHHARNKLSNMIRQKFMNGYWIGLTMGICPKCFSVYHFVPFGFVIGIFLSLLALFLGYPILFKLIFGLYFLCNLVMTVFSIKKQNLSTYLVFLPLVFFVLHFFYGLGTVIGLIKLPFWISKKENRSCEQIENVRRIMIKNSNNLRK